MVHQSNPEEAWREGDDRDYFGYGEDESDGERGYSPEVAPASSPGGGSPGGLSAPTKKLPGYDDPAFFERQNQSKRDPDSHCARHGRALGRSEAEQKVCFWCHPEVYERHLRRRLDMTPPPVFKDPKKKTTAERRQEKAHTDAVAAVKNWAASRRKIDEINAQIEWREQQEAAHGSK